MKNEETVKVLEKFYSKQVVQMEPKEKIEVKDIQKDSVSLKEFHEFQKFMISKMENHEKTIKEHENTIKELKINENQMKSEITNYQNTIKFLDKRIELLEKENKNIESNTRYQVLCDMTSIEEKDLEFNLPIKKRNCFNVKDVQKAKDLGRITSLKDLEKVIENDEFQDIIELKNTLNCLECVIDEWKNDKLKLDDLEKEIDVKQDFDQWKSKDPSILIQFINDHSKDDQFKDFKLFQRIKNDFFNLGRSKKNELMIFIKIFNLSLWNRKHKILLMMK